MDIVAPRRGGEPKPSPAELLGRLVGIIPTALTQEPVKDNAGKPTGAMKDTITANIVVFGSGTFDFGGLEGRMGSQPRPPQLRVTLPYRIDHWVFSNQELVKAVKEYVPAQGQDPSKIVIGVVVRSTVGNLPYQIEVPDASDARWPAAIDFLNGLKDGRYVLQPPIAINQDAPGAQQPAPVGYGAVTQQAAAPAAVAAYAQTAPTTYPTIGQAPAMGAMPPAVQPPLGVPAAPVGYPAPAGFPPAVWQGMTAEQQVAILTKAAADAAAAQAAAAPVAPQFNLDVPVAGLEAYWPMMPAAARQQAYEQAAAATP